jgi:fatty-acid peroxygenase
MAPDALHASVLRAVPSVPGWDHSLQFLADPYRFIGRECRRLGSDVVLARLLLQPTLCLTGPRAAELFNDRTRFRHMGVANETGHAASFDRGPVATAALLARALEQWDRLLPGWCSRSRMVLYGAAQEWLARTACAWAGIALAQSEAAARTSQLAALFDNAAGGIAAHLRARRARREAEGWLAGLIQSHRRRPLFATASPAAVAAGFVDAEGLRLPARLAAIELLNLLRPIVAVSVFVVLAAHALHRHPGWRVALAGGLDDDLRAFVQEVRRFYPFFPAVPAQVSREFVWEGLHFPRGTRAMLDLYGTNHDDRAWPQPHDFRPERFFGTIPGLFDFVPHGGGWSQDPLSLALMKLAAHQLAVHLRYRVPAQDLDLQMDRPPALPRDRFIVERLVPL